VNELVEQFRPAHAERILKVLIGSGANPSMEIEKQRTRNGDTDVLLFAKAVSR
jgi:hypothetical protein